jgi:uncharacterized membrane protein YbhN (UPF0104 family)
VIRCLFLGVALWLSARSITFVTGADFPLLLACSSLASVGGFLAISVPAGIGVHELIYLSVLRPALGPQVAILVVLFRILQTLADAVMGGTGIALLSASPSPDRDDRPRPLPRITSAREEFS